MNKLKISCFVAILILAMSCSDDAVENPQEENIENQEANEDNTDDESDDSDDGDDSDETTSNYIEVNGIQYPFVQGFAFLVETDENSIVELSLIDGGYSYNQSINHITYTDEVTFENSFYLFVPIDEDPPADGIYPVVAQGDGATGARCTSRIANAQGELIFDPPIVSGKSTSGEIHFLMEGDPESGQVSISLEAEITYDVNGSSEIETMDVKIKYIGSIGILEY